MGLDLTTLECWWCGGDGGGGGVAVVPFVGGGECVRVSVRMGV